MGECCVNTVQISLCARPRTEAPYFLYSDSLDLRRPSFFQLSEVNLSDELPLASGHSKRNTCTFAEGAIVVS